MVTIVTLLCVGHVPYMMKDERWIGQIVVASGRLLEARIRRLFRYPQMSQTDPYIHQMVTPKVILP